MSAKKHRHVFQKCILYFHRKNLRTNLWTISCLFFSDFWREVLETVADYLGATLSELPCKCPVESFGERNVNKYFSLFSDGELKIFGFLARRNWQVCRNCILLLCRNILRQKVNVLGFSGKWTDFSPNSAQKLAASLSEVHCTCPEEPFAENKCF